MQYTVQEEEEDKEEAGLVSGGDKKEKSDASAGWLVEPECSKEIKSFAEMDDGRVRKKEAVQKELKVVSNNEKEEKEQNKTLYGSKTIEEQEVIYPVTEETGVIKLGEVPSGSDGSGQSTRGLRQGLSRVGLFFSAVSRRVRSGCGQLSAVDEK